MKKKEPQLKDLFFKDVTQHHAREILDLLQLRGEYEVLDAERNKEVIVRRRESDQVLRVRIGGKIYLFHLEFISHYSRREVRKAYGFGGALTAKHNCDVITVLVVLKPPRAHERLSVTMRSRRWGGCAQSTRLCGDRRFGTARKNYLRRQGIDRLGADSAGDIEACG